VGGGAKKLAHALKMFDINVDGKVCADIGASTGGFTDVMLKHGAAKVYAIDVGYGQLDVSLRNDPRVVNREKVNARFLSEVDFDEPIEFTFTSGKPARMRRGEIILHVCMHGTYHRGNAGAVLQLKGLTPSRDSVTDFLEDTQ
jgi:hypothetical protein